MEGYVSVVQLCEKYTFHARKSAHSLPSVPQWESVPYIDLEGVLLTGEFLLFLYLQQQCMCVRVRTCMCIM
jgi:hypothetical protein